MHGGAWYVRPTDNITATATPTWAVSSADADFPVANVLTLEPDVVAKAVAATATLRLTWGASKTLVGIAFINVNFPGVAVTLSNNGGMVAQVKTVAAPEDEVSASVFFDLTDVANNSATQWDLAVVGSIPVAIGTVIAIEEWSEFRMRWDYELREQFPIIEHRTGYQKRLQYRIPLRYRTFSGTPFYAADRNALRTLRREAQGSIIPWCFVPDLLDDDVLLVQFGGDEHTERTTWFDGLFPDDTASGIVEHPITLQEVSNGISLL